MAALDSPSSSNKKVQPLGKAAVSGAQLVAKPEELPPKIINHEAQAAVVELDELIRQHSLPEPAHPKSYRTLPRLVPALMIFLMLVTAGSAYALSASHPKKPSATKPKVIAVKPVEKKTVATTQTATQIKPPVQQPSSQAATKPSTTTAPKQKAPVTTPTQSAGWNQTPPFISGNFTFMYVGGSQYVTGGGVSASLTQAQPRVTQGGAAGSHHSLMEVAAQSADGKQIVEIGWVVDSGLNGDNLPHLFVYHWVNRQTSCYNGCGFVQTPGAITPGSAVSAGATATYGITQVNGGWHLYYNGQDIGYFPDSLWGNSYTQYGLVQVFGEVATTSPSACIQMGNGIFGNAGGSARISNYGLQGANAGPFLRAFLTSPDKYNYGSVSPTGMNIGGPGTCT